MKINQMNFFKNKINLIPVFILLLCVLVSILPLPFNERLVDASLDILIRFRGERDVTDKILYVQLKEDDIEALGGWPITRDYYGYMTYILSQRGAQTVGFYGLFDHPDRHYPEFDLRFADFIESSQNICLPAAFGQLDQYSPGTSYHLHLPQRIQTGRQLRLPIPLFYHRIEGVGFSNLGEASLLRKVPVAVLHGDSVIYSFGLELARRFTGASAILSTSEKLITLQDPNTETKKIPIDDKGFLRINPIGSLDQVKRMGFLELLQRFETDPDSLSVKGKLVVIDSASPAVPVMKATPLARSVPAALIHVTVAENILSNNFIQTSGIFIKFIILLLIAVFIFYINRRLPLKLFFPVLLGSGAGYVLLSVILISQSNLALPLIYPAIVAVIFTVSLIGVNTYSKKVHHLTETQVYQDQVTETRRQLEEAETQLAQLSDQLNAELKEKESLSTETKQLAEEKQAAVLALEKHLRDLEQSQLPGRSITRSQFGDIVHGPKSKMIDILQMIEKIGHDDIPIIIQGETGTGKELAARAIHQSSRRQRSPFVAVNCGALSETLLESELFGHEKGSFTGANARRRGRFELADGGTLFLDEISETTPTFQSRLLRVLQEGTFERLGGERTLRVDVRVIAATNTDLKAEVEDGRFREDLYYRLAGFAIVIPPLRERQTDIPVLIRHFLKKHGYDQISSLSDRARELMQHHSWPGNVRELENVVRRSAILAQSADREVIRQEDLPEEIREADDPVVETVSYQSLESQILSMLRAQRFSRSAISQTARALDNRDRGTITEYFRGLCFEALVQHDFDVEQAIRVIADTDDEGVLQTVRKKMQDYLRNLDPHINPDTVVEIAAGGRPSCFRGLPKKYHPFLIQILTHYSEGH